MKIKDLYNEDCILGAKKYIKDDTVDLIISDPPYGIEGDKLDKHYNRNENYVIGGYVDVPLSEYKDFSIQWINEAARILKPGGSIYIVSGYTNLHHVLNALHSTNLMEINHLIWKYNFGVHTKNKFVSSHYHILFWQKPRGSPTFNTFCRYGDSEKDAKSMSLNYQDREDVFIINREYKPGEIKNKNELPHELLTKLILYSSNPEDTVCDMFLGGFSTAIVAKGLNRKPMGFEISPIAYEMGINKITSIEEGNLLEHIKKPEANKKINGGKSWTDEERMELRRLLDLCSDKNKKDTLEYIGCAMGRGKWGIENEITRLNLHINTDRRGRPKKSGSTLQNRTADHENEGKADNIKKFNTIDNYY
jgi:DNA modification methylase